MFIGCIPLEHLIAIDQVTSSSSLHSYKFLYVFNIFLLYDRKQDANSTAAHIKYHRVIKKKQFFISGLSNIWENIHGCVYHYICATVLYLFPIFSQAFNIIIDHGISASGHSREVLYILDATEKRFIFHLISTGQLPDSQRFDTQINMHTSTRISIFILVQELDKNLSNESPQCVILNNVNTKKIN